MNIDNVIAREFPQEEGLVYMNHAAVAPWPKRTVDAVREFAEENVRLGAVNYRQWAEKESVLREQIRKLINAASVDEIALVKNTSEALSMVASGLGWKIGDNVVSTDQEFPSNRIPWEAQPGVEIRQVPINLLDEPEAALINSCDDRTRVMSVSSVQFGTGLKLDLEPLGKFCRSANILFCIDAIQSIGAHKLDVEAIQADFVMADAHKWMLGPEGIALFFSTAKAREQLCLHEFGWHMVENQGDYDTQEWQIAASARRFECGSPNMLGIHALSASLSLFEDIGMETIEDRLRGHVDILMENLSQDNRFELLTPLSQTRRAGIVTFRLQNHDMERLHRELLARNIICAHRCGGIRLSPHFYMDQEKIYNILEILSIII